MQKSQHSISQIIDILKQAESGTPVAELCHTHWISSATFYKWKSTFGDMYMSLFSTLKELKAENQRLKSRYAKMQHQKKLIQVILKNN